MSTFYWSFNQLQYSAEVKIAVISWMIWDKYVAGILSYDCTIVRQYEERKVDGLDFTYSHFT